MGRMVRPNLLGWAAWLWEGEAELSSPRPEDSLLLVTVLPGSSAGKESARNAGDLGSIPGLRRSPGEGKGYPLQYSGLENSMDSPSGRKESDMTERLSLHILHLTQKVLF